MQEQKKSQKKRVERHIITKSHYLYNFCDDICYKSKNLYNYSNYIIRQEYIFNHKFTGFYQLDRILKENNQVDYRRLPNQTSQQTLRLLEKDWQSFFAANRDYKENPSKYTGKPRLPKYKKKQGRHIAIFTNQQCEIKDGFIKFPKSSEKIQTRVKENLAQVRIVPGGNCYIIEIVYQIEVPKKFSEIKNAISIDLGVNNLAAIVNNIGLKPVVIEGKIIKSINQYYNKEKARLMSFVGGRGNSNRIISLTEKRNRKIDDYLHKSSRFIIDYCKENSIDTIIIGNNPGWKQKVSTGKVNNQKFVFIPFKKLINQIKYKSEEKGINVKVVQESYTSKASFLDSDNIPEYKVENNEKHTFSGRRIYRGLYKTKAGILINSDCNGAYNCMRKVIPKFSLEEGIEGVGLHPVRLIPSLRQSNKGNLINFDKIYNTF